MGTMVNKTTLEKSANCYDIELLSDFLDGLLDIESSNRIKQQLESDEYLQELVTGLKQIRQEEDLGTTALIDRLKSSSDQRFEKLFGTPGLKEEYPNQGVSQSYDSLHNSQPLGQLNKHSNEYSNKHSNRPQTNQQLADSHPPKPSGILGKLSSWVGKLFS